MGSGSAAKIAMVGLCTVWCVAVLRQVGMIALVLGVISCSSPERHPEAPEMRGSVLSVEEQGRRGGVELELLIREAGTPSAPQRQSQTEEAGSTGWILWLSVLDETQIFRQTADGSLIEVSVDALAVGDEVRFVHMGRVMESDPPQALARRIVAMPATGR